MTLRPMVVTTILLMISTALACDEETRMQPSIQEVKETHEAQLMAVDGVVSVGIGRDDAGRPVIVIGLDSEGPDTRQQLPKRLEGYEVRTEVVGKIRAQ